MRLPRRSLGAVSPSSQTIQQIASAIYTQEGPVQNNNPGNLVYAGQPGATGADSRGFAIFSSLAAGQAAEQNQIALDINRGSCATGAPVATLSDLINCLTPPSLNPAVASGTYTSNVSQATGIDPNAPLSTLADGSITPSDLSGSTLPTVDTSSLGIDLTDPTTQIVMLAGAGLLIWALFRR